MLARKKAGNGSAEIDTYIGASTRVRGDLVLEGNLRVDGRVEGNITGPDQVVIVGKTGVVEGNIVARYVFAGGLVRGDITASQGLEVLSGAEIEGNLNYLVLSIEEGACVQGTFRRLGEGAGVPPADPA